MLWEGIRVLKANRQDYIDTYEVHALLQQTFPSELKSPYPDVTHGAQRIVFDDLDLGAIRCFVEARKRLVDDELTCMMRWLLVSLCTSFAAA